MPPVQPNPPLGSNIPIIMELIFPAAKGREALVLPQDFFQSLTVNLSLKTAWTAAITLFDPTGREIEELLIRLGGNRVLKFRWQWDDGRGFSAKTPLYTGGITKYSPEFTEQGTTLQIELVSQVVHSQVIQKRIRAFSAQISVSDIVELIAEERGWLIKDAEGRPTIESTPKPSGVYLHYSGNTSDTAFIKNKLLPLAVNKQGQGGYEFFVPQDNRVHFHTDAFYDASGRNRALAKFRFARDQMSDVIRFATTDDQFFNAVAGAGDTLFRSVDSLNGKRLALKASRKDGVQSDSPSKQIVGPDSVHFTDVEKQVDADIGTLSSLGNRIGAAISEFGEEVNRTFTWIAREADDMEARTKSRFDQLRKFPIKAELDIRGTHALFPQAMIEVEHFFPQTNDRSKPVLHYLSGVYRISSIEHSISGSGWTSSVNLFRSGHGQIVGAEKYAAQELSLSPTFIRQLGDLSEGATADKEKTLIQIRPTEK